MHKMDCTSPCRCAHNHTPMSELRSFSRRGFYENSDVFQRSSGNVLIVCCNLFPPAACPRSFAVVSASRHANVPIAAGGAGWRCRLAIPTCSAVKGFGGPIRCVGPHWSQPGLGNVLCNALEWPESFLASNTRLCPHVARAGLQRTAPDTR